MLQPQFGADAQLTTLFPFSLPFGRWRWGTRAPLSGNLTLAAYLRLLPPLRSSSWPAIGPMVNPWPAVGSLLLLHAQLYAPVFPLVVTAVVVATAARVFRDRVKPGKSHWLLSGGLRRWVSRRPRPPGWQVFPTRIDPRATAKAVILRTRGERSGTMSPFGYGPTKGQTASISTLDSPQRPYSPRAVLSHWPLCLPKKCVCLPSCFREGYQWLKAVPDQCCQLP